MGASPRYPLQTLTASYVACRVVHGVANVRSLSLNSALVWIPAGALRDWDQAVDWFPYQPHLLTFALAATLQKNEEK